MRVCRVVSDVQCRADWSGVGSDSSNGIPNVMYATDPCSSRGGVSYKELAVIAASQTAGSVRL